MARRPFERLVEWVEQLRNAPDTGPGLGDYTMGELAEAWGEPIGRVMDAIDASKMLRGQATYIPLSQRDEQMPEPKSLTDEQIEALADEAERGYCVQKAERVCGHPLDADGMCDVHGWNG